MTGRERQLRVADPDRTTPIAARAHRTAWPHRGPARAPRIAHPAEPITTPLPVLGPGGFVIADAPTQPIALGRAAGGRRPGAGAGGGAAMSISSALGALAGLVSWLLAARLLPQAEVGLAAAVVSAFILIAGMTQLNLGLGLMRWLPTAGRYAPPLVWRSLLSIMPLSGLVGLGYVLAVPELARTAAGADGSHVLGTCLFVLAAAGWGAFVIHDYVLVAIGKPWWCVWRNGLFAAVRITLLVVLGTTLGAQGVVLSWVGPIVVWIAAGSLVLAVAVRRFARGACGGTMPCPSEVVGFLGPTAVAQMGYTLLLNQVPLVVILRFGPEAGAAFFIAWQATVVVETAATYFTHSLSAACAREPERAAELVCASRRRLLVVFLPLLGVGALLAGPGLSIFGPQYAAAADVLRVLLLGQAFRLIVVHELAVRTATGRGVAFARLHLTGTVLVLAAVALVPAGDTVVGTVVGTAGGTAVALLPVALGYAAVQLVLATHVGVLQLRGLGRALPGRH